MNVILEGSEAVGKSTLAEKLIRKYGMTTIHSTSKTRNDVYYHIDLLDYQNNVVFDRFHVGEGRVYPFIFNRQCKLTADEYESINKRIIENNDLFIIFVCSDLSIIDNRLKSRGEEDQIPLIERQNKLFTIAAHDFLEKYHYKNFYICDIAEEDAYDELDSWIDEHFGKVTTNIAYRKLCNDLLTKGHPMETRNVRGSTNELCNYSFEITDLDTEYVTLKSGGTNISYLAAELLWYWSSRNDLAFIGKFAKLWDKVTDDGKTANSAYGYILQEKHGFNQIEKIIELLKADPYSRRAVMNINVPNERVIETKDEMCTICLDYQIRNGKLHCTCVMRSNDARYGFLNDCGFFISLQKYIASRLGVPTGTYTHYAMSIHFYNRDFEFIKNVAYGTLETQEERLDITKLLENREELVDWVDNHFTNREDWKEKLRAMNIIHKMY